MNEQLEVNNTEVTVANTETNTTEAANQTDTKNKELFKEIVQEDNSQEFDASTLDGKSLDELVEEARGLLIQTPKTASMRLKVIRTVFYDKYNLSKDEAKEQYTAERTDESPDFVYEKSGLIDNLKEIEDEIKKAREEEKRRVEAEKKSNLARKEALIAQLEIILGSDETLETIAEVKEIQKEWKTIRVLPKEAIGSLWDRYNVLLNSFYDNHGINIELKELDRQKNLESKIELTKKVETIKDGKSLDSIL